LYLVLNVVVSAATTLLVLCWWEQTHAEEQTGSDVSTQLSQAFPASERTTVVIATTQAELPPIDQPIVQIENVFGVGDVESEVVLVKRIGEGELFLTDWKLVDEDGHIFIFPHLSLNKGIVQIYTDPGPSDLANGLHWGLEEAVWQIGEMVILLDPMDNVRATYRIP